MIFDRALAPAVLPLAFLHSFAIGLLELPLLYLFRDIRCEQYRRNTSSDLSNVTICRNPIVERAYATDVAINIGIETFLSVIVSGPYGWLSDAKGRRFVMQCAATLSVIADIWLCICAYFTPLRSPIFIFLAAIMKGLGGGFSVVNAAQSAFIAESSTPDTRSFFLGLGLVAFWAASALAPLVSASLVSDQHYVANFALSASSWMVYLLYVVVVLREKWRQPAAMVVCEPANSSGVAPSVTSRTTKMFLRSIIDPLTLVMGNPIMRWFGISDLMMLVALGAFGLLIIYCDHMFGVSPKEAGIMISVKSLGRVFSLLCVLPVLIKTYHRFTEPANLQVDISSSEALLHPSLNPVLSIEGATAEELITADTLAMRNLQKKSVAQELFICRICFALDALGMILISLSRNTMQTYISIAIGSFGAPGAPSLQALVTLISPPAELGRILAGFSIIESTALAIRSPVLVMIYTATLERWTGAMWWFAAASFLLCTVIVLFLRPSRLVYRRIH